MAAVCIAIYKPQVILKYGQVFNVVNNTVFVHPECIIQTFTV